MKVFNRSINTKSLNYYPKPAIIYERWYVMCLTVNHLSKGIHHLTWSLTLELKFTKNWEKNKFKWQWHRKKLNSFFLKLIGNCIARNFFVLFLMSRGRLLRKCFVNSSKNSEKKFSKKLKVCKITFFPYLISSRSVCCSWRQINYRWNSFAAKCIKKLWKNFLKMRFWRMKIILH